MSGMGKAIPIALMLKVTSKLGIISVLILFVFIFILLKFVFNV